jgi:hypothetical protein
MKDWFWSSTCRRGVSGTGTKGDILITTVPKSNSEPEMTLKCLSKRDLGLKSAGNDGNNAGTSE